MADERQPQSATQTNGQNQQPQAQQSTQPMQRSGQQTGMTRGGGGLPSVFNLDLFDMLRTSPFALMRRFSEEMDQWFEQLGMGRGVQGMPLASGGRFAPPVEVFERDGNMIVRADLPGLTKDDVRVEITDNALLIEGERRSEHEERQGGTFHSERHYGMFRRQIPLPEGVNAEQATANFKDGVLEITMPAPQRQARGRRIEIHSGAPSTPESQASSSTTPAAAGSTGQPASSTGQARS